MKGDPRDLLVQELQKLLSKDLLAPDEAAEKRKDILKSL
jgi:hypothetical protein